MSALHNVITFGLGVALAALVYEDVLSAEVAAIVAFPAALLLAILAVSLEEQP